MIKKEINKNFLTLAITSTCTSQSLGKNLGTMFSHITCSPPKIWITIDCFQFLLCITVVPREIEENGLQNVFLFFSFFEGEGGGGNKVYFGQCENGELQPKLLHSIVRTCPSQSLGKIPGFEVAGTILIKTGRSPLAKSHMV